MVPFLRRLFTKRSSPMACHEVAQLVQQYLDDELDEHRAARLRAHLDDCRRCGLEVDTYRRIKHSLADSSVSVPEESVARLREFAMRLARGEEPDGVHA